MQELRYQVWRPIYRLQDLWWHFRNEVYYYEVPVLPPIQSSSGDDTANIQNAINEATREPEWFKEIYAAYQRKWYRFFIKKPVLKAAARLQAGIYNVGNPINIGGSIDTRGAE